MEQMLLWIPLLPLLAFLINGLAGRHLKEIGGWIAVFAMSTSALLSIMLFLWAWNHEADLPLTLELWPWISVGDLEVVIGLHFDQLTAVMCFVVTFVGSLVFLYSIGYMAGDPGFNRFFSFLSLFAFSMLVLVLADSFPLLFVGWEGVGLCSYLLIGYYMDMPGAPEAGKKAFVVNRIGDFGFLLAMFLIYQHCGTLNIAEVLDQAPEALDYGAVGITAITLLMFLACTGKSAQIPLFAWLPDAMAGPTPVSALIHAATMVTAGVYLVARASVLFAMAPITMTVIAVTGAATAFIAATIALTQRDIKKVLAYSTISQLGYMFLACGVGAFTAGIFHVMTHAFFKACLFLGAGVIIHSIGGVQDLFLMGGLKNRLRTCWITFAIACLAIAGFPLTAGFFSKDEILWKAFSASPANLRLMNVPVLYLIGLITAVMTAVYIFRALYLAFHGEMRLPKPNRSHIHAPHWTMNAALIVLAAGSLMVGFLNVSPAMGGGADLHHFLGSVMHESESIIANHVPQAAAQAGHGLELGMTLLSIVMAVAGILLAAQLFLRRWPDATGVLASRYALFYQISRGGWWWDLFGRAVIGGGVRLLGRVAVWLDRTILDGILHVIGKIALELSRAVRNLQMGQVQAYAMVMLIGANILLFVILWMQ